MQSEFIVGQGDDCRDVVVQGIIHGRKLHLLRCKTPKQGEIFVTDDREDYNAWFEILAVGEKCIHFGPDDVGGFVWLPVSPIGKETWCWKIAKAEIMAREVWFEQVGGPPLMVLKGD